MPAARASARARGGLEGGRAGRVGRGVAAAAATAMTLALLAPFLLGRSSVPGVRQAPALQVLLIAPAQPAALPWIGPATGTVASQRRRRPVPPPVEFAPPQTSQMLQETQAPQAAAASALHDTAAAGSPGSAGSAPLRLDTRVLREAARASRSAWGRLAQPGSAASGAAPSAAESPLAQGVARSAKPACLRPGGSLLSIFAIGYEILADQCR